jgi:hypothetical protein
MRNPTGTSSDNPLYRHGTQKAAAWSRKDEPLSLSLGLFLPAATRQSGAIVISHHIRKEAMSAQQHSPTPLILFQNLLGNEKGERSGGSAS